MSRRCTRAFGTIENHHIRQVFLVAAAHVVAELREFFLAGADIAFVHVMRHVIRQAVEHRGRIASIESVEVALNDMHVSAPGAESFDAQKDPVKGKMQVFSGKLIAPASARPNALSNVR